MLSGIVRNEILDNMLEEIEALIDGGMDKEALREYLISNLQ